jgi:guanine deaminase
MISKELIIQVINKARETMRKGEGGPFGACVITPSGDIFVASNQVLKDKDPTAHAEICAIRKACKHLNSHDLSGCILYTTCKPCPMCMSAIIWANIKVVYYSATEKDASAIGFRDDFIYKFLRNQLSSEVISCIQIPSEEAQKLFDEYALTKSQIY